MGHHGSHNATLRAHGLEEMKALQAAMIPVDHAMALKKRWGAMPLPELVQRLGEVTAGRVLRTDEPVPATLSAACEPKVICITKSRSELAQPDSNGG